MGLTSLGYGRNLANISRDTDHPVVVSHATESLSPTEQYGGSTLFATTQSGTLWVYPHPISKETEYEEILLHSTKRKSARPPAPTLSVLIPSESRLVTGSMDGSLFMLSLAGKQAKLPRGDDVCL